MFCQSLFEKHLQRVYIHTHIYAYLRTLKRRKSAREFAKPADFLLLNVLKYAYTNIDTNMHIHI